MTSDENHMNNKDKMYYYTNRETTTTHTYMTQTQE